MDFAGLDAHKDNVVLCVVNEKARTVREETFLTNELDLSRLVHIVKDAHCVLEACSTCYPVYDALGQAGVKIKVAHPLLLKSLSGLKKTDKVDAKRMALMLKAGVIPEAHIPTKTVRLQRELVKQHISLVQHRTRYINKLRSLLLRYGIRPKTKNLFGKRATWMEKTVIPEELRAILSQHLNQIQYLTEQKKLVDADIKKQAQNNPQAKILYTLPGVGWYIAFLVIVIVDGMDRFHSPEQLVSYAGLRPAYTSQATQRITVIFQRPDGLSCAGH